MAQSLEKICVPICVKSARDLDSAVARACEVGDLIELRFDCLEPAELGQALAVTRPLLSKLARPFIVTYRSAEEGGKCVLDREARLKFWLFDRPREAAFYDIELDLVEGLAASDFGQHDVNWSAVICSHHDYAGVPGDLEQIYERMTRTPARVMKIAVQGDDITDCIPVFDLLERARREGRELIAIAM